MVNLHAEDVHGMTGSKKRHMVRKMQKPGKVGMEKIRKLNMRKVKRYHSLN
jgi:hypothetical protein